MEKKKNLDLFIADRIKIVPILKNETITWVRNYSLLYKERSP